MSGMIVVILIPLLIWTSWTEILFFIDFESLDSNEQGYAEYRHRDSGIVFVSLPGGVLMQGAMEIEKKHIVGLEVFSPFMIAKYEVTQGQWEEVMGEGSNPSHYKGEELPVAFVSWDDLHSEGGFLGRTGFMLPTEAQWEYACRAGTQGPFSGTGKLDDMGWYEGNSGRQTHPVGQKQPNHFGLYDMHGNVWEWCEDLGYRSKRLCRGGSFNETRGCHSNYPLDYLPTRRTSDLGFRLVAPPP